MVDILKHRQMFDTSLPVSPLIPLDALPDPHNVSLWCKVVTPSVEIVNICPNAGERCVEAGGQHEGHDLHSAKAHLLHI